MQATCPSCNNRIAVDDAKAPDRPFNVKCPKCQAIVRFPGKGAAQAAAAAPAPAPARGGGATEETSAPQPSRGPVQKLEGRALVALPDRNLAGSLTVSLSHLGLSVETLDDWEQGARLVDQGAFNVVATTRAAAGKGESLYQRIGRLPPDARRGLFVILVGDEYKSGDGTQAWAMRADLVIHTRDAGGSEGLIGSVHAERARAYQTYVDARQRFEASKGY